MSHLLYFICAAIGLCALFAFIAHDYVNKLCDYRIALLLFIMHGCTVTAPIFEIHARSYDLETTRILCSAFMHLCLAVVIITRLVSTSILLERLKLLRTPGIMNLTNARIINYTRYYISFNCVAIVVSVISYIAISTYIFVK